jgi:CDP-6-deoxy-D-xylo-4-hexulose-3-dehydrase
MIKLVSDTIDKSDIEALVQWLQQETTPNLTKGKVTVELEKKWANHIGTKYSLFVNSGSSAIFLVLTALQQMNRINNKIVVPSLSWVTDVSSPLILGMEPVLCDCNLYDLSYDLNMLEDIFIKHKPSTVILVSVLGLVPDMNRIIELCERHKVILLEDACESMNSKYNEKHLGSFGTASMFSLYFGHHISTIEGGFINTNDYELYKMLLMIRSHGWGRDLSEDEQSELRKLHGISNFDSLYTFYVYGMNLRSTDLQAFIGLRGIDKLNMYSIKRNKNFMLYNSLIKNNEIKLKINDADFISNHAYPIANYNKERIVNALISNEIGVRPLIAGNMANKPFWYKNFEVPYLPNSEFLDKFGFYLPNHHDLTDNQILEISDIVNENS